MPKGLKKPQSDCHPARPHYAHGLCNSCHRRDKYASDLSYREHQKRKAMVYRKMHADKARQSARKYYSANRAVRIAKSREYVLADPVRARLQRRRYYLANRETLLQKQRLARVGLTGSEYDTLLVQQSGVCAICKNSNNGRQLIPDHCHKTLAVRGLLCHKCNVGIGLLGDSAEILESALLYLSKQQSIQEKVISAKFGINSSGV